MFPPDRRQKAAPIDGSLSHSPYYSTLLSPWQAVRRISTAKHTPAPVSDGGNASFGTRGLNFGGCLQKRSGMFTICAGCIFVEKSAAKLCRLNNNCNKKSTGDHAAVTQKQENDIYIQKIPLFLPRIRLSFSLKTARFPLIYAF